MAVPILSMQFDSTGCTNRKIRNLGGVSFNSSSCLGKKDLRAAYFQPYHADAGFEIINDTVRQLLESGQAWSLYFKYKVDQVSEATLPIISYHDGDEWNTTNLLTVENGKIFVLQASTWSTYFSRNVSYTFDNKWHTFYLMYDEEHTLRLMLDGQLILEIYEADLFNFGRQFYIGYSRKDGDTTVLNGWYIDDFNFFKDCVYKDEFIPPTEYISGSDVLSNYRDNSVSNIDNLESELKDSIEHQREHSVSFINEMQRGWLPRRMRFNWHEDKRGYFRNHAYQMISKIDTSTYINVEGIDQPLLTGNDQYYEALLEVALDTNKVLPMMIFINGQFRRLSKIKIVKSDDYYCFIFTDRNRYTEEPVTSFEVIILPFPVIYEEDYGERADQSPLYVFNREGKFDPVNGHTFYYLDQMKVPYLQHIGIREQLLPNDVYLKTKTKEEKAVLANKAYMKFVWRYGKLELRRLDDEGTGAFMTFRSDDYSWIKPGDDILLYNGTVLVDPSLYEIVGYDLLYFEDLEKAGIREGRTITMQVVTDSQNPKDTMLFQDLTQVKTITVEATAHNQSVFKIPEVYDGDGVEWRKFLLFKGHVLMENEKRYTIDYDKGIVKLNDPRDFMTKGRHLLFVFIKVKKADSRGNLYVKPIVSVGKPVNGIQCGIPIPEEYVEPTKENVMVFRNNTFVSPARYEIDTRELIMNKDEVPFDASTNLIFVMLKVVSPYDDPNGWRYETINQEIEKGNRFVLYDLGISKKIKITLDNLLCFDEDGVLITDLRGKIYDFNIIKRLATFEPLERRVRYLTCLYRTDALKYEGNALLPLNDTFMREYLKGRQEYYEMDQYFNELMEEFNFHHRKDLTYGENLSRSLNYILAYNQNKFDTVYDQRATATRRLYNTTGLNQSMIRDDTEGVYKLKIPRDDYQHNVSRTYPIFFENGKLASWSGSVEEDGNDLIISLPNKLAANTKIESIDFHNIKNFLIPLKSVVTSDKKASLMIPCKLTIGEEFAQDFLAGIVVKQDKELTIPSRIEVVQGFKYVEARNGFKVDAFPCTIVVQREHQSFFTARIEIPEEPQGIEVDLDHFNIHYGFFSRIEVQNGEEATTNE